MISTDGKHHIEKKTRSCDISRWKEGMILYGVVRESLCEEVTFELRSEQRRVIEESILERGKHQQPEAP